MQRITNANKLAICINGKKFIKNSINIKKRNKYFDEKTVKSLLKSEEDIEKGRTRNATEVMNEFKKRYRF